MTRAWKGYTCERIAPTLTEARWYHKEDARVLFVQLTPYYPFSLMQTSRLRVDIPFEPLAHKLYRDCISRADSSAIAAILDDHPMGDNSVDVSERLAYYSTPFSHVVGIDCSVQFFGNSSEAAKLIMCRTADRNRRAQGCLATALYFPDHRKPDQLTLTTTNIESQLDTVTVTQKTLNYVRQLYVMARGESQIIKQLLATRAFTPQHPAHSNTETTPRKPTAAFEREVVDRLATRQFQLTKQLRRAEHIMNYQTESQP